MTGSLKRTLPIRQGDFLRPAPLVVMRSSNADGKAREQRGPSFGMRAPIPATAQGGIIANNIKRLHLHQKVQRFAAMQPRSSFPVSGMSGMSEESLRQHCGGDHAGLGSAVFSPNSAVTNLVGSKVSISSGVSPRPMNFTGMLS